MPHGTDLAQPLHGVGGVDQCLRAVDARCGTVAAQAEQPFDAERDPEGGQRPLTAPMDEMLCSVERFAAAAGSGEIDPNLDGGGFTATPARGRTDAKSTRTFGAPVASARLGTSSTGMLWPGRAVPSTVRTSACASDSASQVKTPSRRTKPAVVTADQRSRSAIPAGPPVSVSSSATPTRTVSTRSNSRVESACGVQ